MKPRDKSVDYSQFEKVRVEVNGQVSTTQIKIIIAVNNKYTSHKLRALLVSKSNCMRGAKEVLKFKCLDLQNETDEFKKPEKGVLITKIGSNNDFPSGLDISGCYDKLIGSKKNWIDYSVFEFGKISKKDEKEEWQLLAYGPYQKRQSVCNIRNVFVRNHMSCLGISQEGKISFRSANPNQTSPDQTIEQILKKYFPTAKFSSEYSSSEKKEAESVVAAADTEQTIRIPNNSPPSVNQCPTTEVTNSQRTPMAVDDQSNLAPSQFSSSCSFFPYTTKIRETKKRKRDENEEKQEETTSRENNDSLVETANLNKVNPQTELSSFLSPGVQQTPSVPPTRRPLSTQPPSTLPQSRSAISTTTGMTFKEIEETLFGGNSTPLTQPFSFLSPSVQPISSVPPTSREIPPRRPFSTQSTSINTSPQLCSATSSARPMPKQPGTFFYRVVVPTTSEPVTNSEQSTRPHPTSNRRPVDNTFHAIQAPGIGTGTPSSSPQPAPEKEKGDEISSIARPH